MKILGLIGGTSWHSTVDYYRIINQEVNAALGGLNSAQCMIYSFNFDDIQNNNNIGDWEKTFQMVFDAGKHLKVAGAEAIVLCANTTHFIADRLEASLGIPVIHIATATAKEITKHAVKTVGLLGTKFTMELDFFKAKLEEQGLKILIPDEEERMFLHHTIFSEFAQGIFSNQTKTKYLIIIENLISRGAEGIILGCTEIPLLIRQSDVKVPIFDTTILHSKAAVEFALS